jgi:hypothetical protein
VNHFFCRFAQHHLLARSLRPMGETAISEMLSDENSRDNTRTQFTFQAVARSEHGLELLAAVSHGHSGFG